MLQIKKIDFNQNAKTLKVYYRVDTNEDLFNFVNIFRSLLSFYLSVEISFEDMTDMGYTQSTPSIFTYEDGEIFNAYE